ncbi:MAG TPA: hypothetical protein DG753_05145 [Clostridium sp.]|nr:hypothetical protein [Clostridium sp.]
MEGFTFARVKTRHSRIEEISARMENNCTEYNSFPEKASQYDLLKQKLAQQYMFDRTLYTKGKQDLINRLLIEAKEWRIR